MVYVINFSAEKMGTFMTSAMHHFNYFDYFQSTYFDDKRYMTKGFIEFKGNDIIQGLFLKSELQAVVDATIQLILTNPQKIRNIHSVSYNKSDEYFAFGKKLLATNLEFLSNEELGKLYFDYLKASFECHQSAIATTWFVDSHEEQFSKLLLEKVKGLLAKAKLDLDPATTFSLLTTDTRVSRTTHEELEFLHLVLQHNEKYDDLRTTVTNHHQRWSWLSYNYMGPSLSVNHYMTEAKKLLLDGTAKQKLENLQKRPDKIHAERQKLITNLQLSKDDQELFDLAADIVFLKNYRKEAMFHGCYALSFLFKEMAKRKYLSFNQMHFLVPGDIQKFYINDEEPDLSELSLRMQSNIHTGMGSKFTVLSGHEASKLLKKIDIEDDTLDSNTSLFKGTCASGGKAKGKVCIVNFVEDLPKMEEGDIMLAHTTFPSLVPAMKKAAAIVTEDGGITCHAAIVSRELGVPCVTGIKTITKTLVDGDLIEVDASNGLVKKL